jgi:hypothetical protein
VGMIILVATYRLGGPGQLARADSGMSRGIEATLASQEFQCRARRWAATERDVLHRLVRIAAWCNPCRRSNDRTPDRQSLPLTRADGGPGCTTNLEIRSFFYGYTKEWGQSAHARGVQREI